MSDMALGHMTRRPFVMRYPSVLIFLICLALFTIVVTFLSEAFGTGSLSTSFVKTLGKTLGLCLVALAMDLVWGYCGILSLGHMAFFGDHDEVAKMTQFHSYFLYIYYAIIIY